MKAAPPKAMERMPDDPELLPLAPEEYLYLRIPKSIWRDASARIENRAIRMPDMSVGRSLLGHPEWLRFDTENVRHYGNWGIAGFRVCDLPSTVDRISRSTVVAEHDPLDGNYPHVEVRLYIAAERVGKSALDNYRIAGQDDETTEELFSVWRDELLQRVRAFILPDIKTSVRPHRPASHVPEPHIGVNWPDPPPAKSSA